LRFAKIDPAWSWKFRLLEAEVMANRGLNRDVLSTLSADLPPQLAGGDLAAKKLALEALALANTGQFSDADRNLAKAQSLCETSSCEVSGEIAQMGGVIQIKENHPEQAETYFRTSLRIARQEKQPVLEAAALQNLGVVALYKEHFDESIDWSEQALQAAQAIGSPFGEEKAGGNLGWAYYKLGDFEKAREYFADTAARAHHLGAIKDETTWLNNLGLVYFERDQPVLAGENYHASLDLAQKTQSADLILASLNALAFLSIKTEQFPEARQYSQQAFDLAHRIGDHPDEVYALLAKGQIAAASSDAVGAEKLFTEVANDPASDTSLRWEAQNSLAKLFESENQTAAADAEYKRALLTVEHARSAIQHEDFRLPFLANAAHLYDDYIHFLVTHGKTTEALQAADYSRAQTLQEGLGLRQQSDGVSRRALNIRDLARKTNSTILFYWLGPQYSYLWGFNSKQISFTSLSPSQKIDGLVERYRRILVSPRDPIEIRSTEGSELYDVLIRPVQNLILPNSRVIVLPDGSLNTLNFETLLVPKPSLHYWIEDVTLLTASSLRLLPGIQRHMQSGHKLLLIGDPVAVSTEYEELPNASLEIQNIEKHFQPDQRNVYVGGHATPAAYLDSSPAQFSLIHFVAHGTASTLSPLDSSVVLSKDNSDDSYKLYARDVVTHPLHADLVTISSCYGAGTRFYTGEGLIGLSWSFLRAGARNVVGALWAVSDTSTPSFMDDFYDQLTRGESPEVGLRAAKLHMLHSTGVFRKPFYWAPFQLYTGS